MNREGSRDCQCKLSCCIWNEMQVSTHISMIACMTRDTTLNMWLHYSWYLQRAERTNPCLIQCLINSLSSCVYRGERGYTVCKERGCVFEVVFCKSLEDNQARGWTQAVGREATTTSPLRGQNWASPWPCLPDWITIVICLLETIYPITNIMSQGEKGSTERRLTLLRLRLRGK